MVKSRKRVTESSTLSVTLLVINTHITGASMRRKVNYLLVEEDSFFSFERVRKKISTRYSTSKIPIDRIFEGRVMTKVIKIANKPAKKNP